MPLHEEISQNVAESTPNLHIGTAALGHVGYENEDPLAGDVDKFVHPDETKD